MVLHTKLFILFLISNVIIGYGKGESEESKKKNARKFPEGFLFGTATASYQVEGAWDTDGKTESIWDQITHKEPCLVVDCSNGDIADDSYNLYKRDIEMMRELGLDYQRFSLSWNRILPTGFPNKINEPGVRYYNNLINEMLKYNIQPMVTLYHWDLPQKLQELGGWANPHVTDWFADYARVAFEQFGDRVKYWLTMNEPREICYQGYGDITKPPMVNIKGIAEYMCAKNLLVAHAKAFHIYDKEFRGKYNGSVGIALGTGWYEPESKEDVVATEVVLQFDWDQYAYPIFSKTGDFPPMMKENIAIKSAAQGFSKSRLPEFTEEELQLVRGSFDFMGLNHYTTYLVKNSSEELEVPSYWDDIGATRFQPDNWDSGAASWIKIVPNGFYKLLKKIKEDYDNPLVIITENGFPTRGGLVDDDRIAFYRLYIDAMLDAIDEGSNVIAFTAWSLMDNFEWMQGYTERFGLYEVNYTDPMRPRTPRKSAFVFKEMIRMHALDYDYEPITSIMTIDQGH